MLFPKRYADAVARLRVPAGFVLVFAFGWLSQPSVESLLAGGAVAALGMLLRGWAAGHLEKNRELATSGPYGYLRNPLYVGTMLVAAGLAIASRRVSLGLLFACFFLFVYLPVIQLEEQHLRKLFPSYAQYALEVPSLWPTFRYRGSGGRFRWPVYMRNQEYQALLGFAAGMILLAWKAVA